MNIHFMHSNELQAQYTFSITKNQKPCILKHIAQNTEQTVWTFDGVTITDTFIHHQPFLTIQRQILIHEEGLYHIHCAIAHDLTNAEIFIPGVMYQRNTKGKGSYPRITKENKSWSFDETRSTIPGCLVLSNTKAIMIVAHRANRVKSSSSFTQNSIGFTLPSEEWPSSYVGKNTLLNTMNTHGKTALHCFAEQTIHQEFIIYVAPMNGSSLFEHYQTYCEFFIKFPHKTQQKSTFSTTEALLLTHLLSFITFTDTGCFLKMGKENGTHQSIYEYTSASFLVKSLEAAVVFHTLPLSQLKAAVKPEIAQILSEAEKKYMKGNSYETIAQKIGDFFLQAERKEGIFQDCYDLTHQKWAGYLGVGEHEDFNHGINARTNGEAMMAYLELYNTSTFANKPRYLRVMNHVALFYIQHQEDNGNYGRWWNVDGTVINDEGTNGAYILSFFTRLYQTTKSKRLLDSIHKAIPYYRSLIEKGEFYADTLDADSCDREAGIALLSAFLDVYHLEKHREYLALCEKCAHYILTWIEMDTIIFDADSPLGTRNFNTQGMSSVSIANQHLDCYGTLIAYQFLRLYRATKKTFYKDLSLLLIKASSQLIASPSDPLGQNSDFYGWIPEQINHTHWAYFHDQNKSDGTFSINIAWVHVLVLDYLYKIETEFSKEVNNEI